MGGVPWKRCLLASPMPCTFGEEGVWVVECREKGGGKKMGVGSGIAPGAPLLPSPIPCAGREEGVGFWVAWVVWMARCIDAGVWGGRRDAVYVCSGERNGTGAANSVL